MLTTCVLSTGATFSFIVACKLHTVLITYVIYPAQLEAKIRNVKLNSGSKNKKAGTAKKL